MFLRYIEQAMFRLIPFAERACYQAVKESSREIQMRRAIKPAEKFTLCREISRRLDRLFN
jgi:hypothetical protein